MFYGQGTMLLATDNILNLQCFMRVILNDEHFYFSCIAIKDSRISSDYNVSWKKRLSIWGHCTL